MRSFKKRYEDFKDERERKQKEKTEKQIEKIKEQTEKQEQKSKLLDEKTDAQNALKSARKYGELARERYNSNRPRTRVINDLLNMADRESHEIGEAGRSLKREMKSAPRPRYNLDFGADVKPRYNYPRKSKRHAADIADYQVDDMGGILSSINILGNRTPDPLKQMRNAAAQKRNLLRQVQESDNRHPLIASLDLTKTSKHPAVNQFDIFSW